MFKFLVYLFLFYSVTRFIFGTLLNFKKNTQNQNNNDNIGDESDIKINKTKNSSTKQQPSSNKSNLGEYVDFEEVK
ncbi:MAG: hypothetical protein WCI53_06820 [Bacteroidota bacterium]|jgi:hypothetical protein